MKIMVARPEQAAAILRLQRLAYESEALLYDDWSIPPLVQTLEEMEEEFRTKLVLVATLDDAVLGSVRARLSDGICHVGKLIVRPTVQGRGIGTALMGEIEASFPEAERYELFTGQKSERNLGLYSRLGYEQVRRVPVSEKLTLVYMQKIGMTEQAAFAPSA
jgi:Acetyltransferase (GNAT) family.